MEEQDFISHSMIGPAIRMPRKKLSAAFSVKCRLSRLKTGSNTTCCKALGAAHHASSAFRPQTKNSGGVNG